jgi:hypothetical protein
VDFDLDDLSSTGGGEEEPIGRGRGKRKKPPQVNVRWSLTHYLALAVGLFALVCIVWAVLSELAF